MFESIFGASFECAAIPGHPRNRDGGGIAFDDIERIHFPGGAPGGCGSGLHYERRVALSFVSFGSIAGENAVQMSREQEIDSAFCKYLHSAPCAVDKLAFIRIAFGQIEWMMRYQNFYSVVGDGAKVIAHDRKLCSVDVAIFGAAGARCVQSNGCNLLVLIKGMEIGSNKSFEPRERPGEAFDGIPDRNIMVARNDNLWPRQRMEEIPRSTEFDTERALGKIATDDNKVWTRLMHRTDERLDSCPVYFTEVDIGKVNDRPHTVESHQYSSRFLIQAESYNVKAIIWLASYVCTRVAEFFYMTSELHHPHPIEQLPRRRVEKLLKIVTSYYFIALAVGACFAYLFGWLADEVAENEFGMDNTAILLNIHAHRSATLDRLAFDITFLGSTYGILLISIVILGSLWLLKRYVDLGMYAAVLIGASVMVITFKLFFHQLRPQVFTPLVQETNYSFPSGHSLTSFAVWGFVAWWVVSIDPKQIWRWCLGLLGVLIAALVACSRLYLGVHWPTDVLAGVFLGFGWVAVCALGQRWLTRHARRERRKQLQQKRLASAG